MADRCAGDLGGGEAANRLSLPQTQKVPPIGETFGLSVELSGSPSWIRTNDQVINSHLLYR